MRDPQRLRQLRAGEVTAVLLESARDDAPRAGAEDRGLAAIGVLGVAHASALNIGAATKLGTAAGSPKAVASSGLIVVAKWVGVGAVATVASMGVTQIVSGTSTRGEVLDPAYVVPTGTDSPRRATAPSSASIRTPPEAATATESVPSVPDPRATPPLESPLLRRSALAARSASALSREAPVNVGSVDSSFAPAPSANFAQGPESTSAASVTTPSRLAQEISALDTARSALRSGRAARALELLDDYDRAFSRGRLAPEATLLRIEAFLRLGQRTPAEQLARRFLSEEPTSAHAATIRRLLGRDANQR